MSHTNNASAYKINQRLQLLRADLSDYRAALDHSIVNLKIAEVVTFILYFTAVWTLYVYDVWGITDFLSNNMGDLPAFAIFGTVSVMLPRFLSRTKKDRYEDIAENIASGYRLSGIATLTLIFFACSGLFFELFTATSQQQHITTTAAENSKSFKATESTITIASTSGEALAAAERKVALCYAKKEKTCVGDEAKVNSLKEQQARDSKQQIDAGAALFSEQHKAREELKEEANKPLFKMIRDSLGVSINTGMIIGVAIMITIFELTHIINLFTYASRLRRWREANNQFIELNGEYMELTGHTVSESDFDDMKKPTKATVANPVINPTINNSIPRDFKNPSPINTPANNAAIAKDTRPSPSSIASTIKMIIDGVDTNKAKNPDDIKKAVYNTYSVLPNPAPLDDGDLDKVAEKIAEERSLNQASPSVIAQPPAPTPTPEKRAIGFHVKYGAPTQTAKLPTDQHTGGTGIHNPVLGKAEAIYPLPLPTTELADRSSLTDSNDLADRHFVDRNSLTGQRKSVNEINAANDGQRLEEMAKKLAKAEKELAEKTAKEAADRADRIAAEANAQAKRTAEEEAQKRAVAAKEAADRADRIAAEKQAIADRIAAEAKAAADLADRQAAVNAAAKEAADRIAAEKQAIADRIAAEAKAAADLADRQAAVNAAAKEAADRIAAAEQEAADRAERGSLTDEQIEIAVNVIRNAVNEKHITTLGFPSTAPLLKAAGLPTSTDLLKALGRLACKQLALEGLVIQNPKPAKGQPLYIIA